MIGIKYCVEEHVEKGNDGANVLKWNLEVQPFDAE